MPTTFTITLSVTAVQPGAVASGVYSGSFTIQGPGPIYSCANGGMTAFTLTIGTDAFVTDPSPDIIYDAFDAHNAPLDSRPSYNSTTGVLSCAVPGDITLIEEIISGTQPLVLYPFPLVITMGNATLNGAAGSLQFNTFEITLGTGSYTFTGAGSPLSLSCNNPPGGTVGTFYSSSLLASGGTPPYTFALIGGSLPPGLSLDTVMGVISGVPTTPGTFPFTVQVTDSVSATASVMCSISIVAAMIQLPPSQAGGMGCVPHCYNMCPPKFAGASIADELLVSAIARGLGILLGRR